MKKYLIILLLFFSCAVYSQVVISTTVFFQTETEESSTLLDDLVGYWNLDETSGTTSYDATDYSYDLSIGGTPILNGSGIKSGYTFDGTTDYVIRESNTPALNPTGSFTLSAWIKTSSETDWIGVASNGYNGGFSLLMLGGKTRFGLNTNIGSQTIVGGTSINNNAWHYIVILYDGSYIKLYIDGVSDATPVAQTGTITYSGDVWENYFIIGSNNPYHTEGSLWIGDIDEIGFWSKALSTDEITELYNSGSGVAYPF